MIMAIAAQAKPPRLACEKLFSHPFKEKNGYEMVTKKSEESYYRRITTTDKKLIEEAKKLVEADSKRADNMVSGYEAATKLNHIILNIENNGKIINVGFWWRDSGYMDLFVEGPMAAFR